MHTHLKLNKILIEAFMEGFTEWATTNSKKKKKKAEVNADGREGWPCLFLNF